MMNKGLEVIEASRLFDLPPRKCTIAVHPQSIAHGFVLFTDGSVKGQLAIRTCASPSATRLAYPDRLPDRALVDRRAGGSWGKTRQPRACVMTLSGPIPSGSPACGLPTRRWPGAGRLRRCSRPPTKSPWGRSSKVGSRSATSRVSSKRRWRTGRHAGNATLAGVRAADREARMTRRRSSQGEVTSRAVSCHYSRRNRESRHVPRDALGSDRAARVRTLSSSRAATACASTSSRSAWARRSSDGRARAAGRSTRCARCRSAATARWKARTTRPTRPSSSASSAARSELDVTTTSRPRPRGSDWRSCSPDRSRTFCCAICSSCSSARSSFGVASDGTQPVIGPLMQGSPADRRRSAIRRSHRRAIDGKRASPSGKMLDRYDSRLAR